MAMITTTEHRPFIFDGVRSIRSDQIESIEPDRRGRVVRTVSGRQYVSEGDALDLIDLLM